MARIQTALTPTQLMHKRGTEWRGTQYVSVSRPALVLQATVSQTPSGDAFAQISCSVTAGDYNAVKVGMTIQIGDFIGRVRQLPDATTLYINETSHKIQQGDVIKIFNDYRAWGILGRVVNDVQVIDWDKSYQSLRPLIRNLEAVRVGWVSASTDDKLQLSFAPTAYPAEAGATIDNGSWRWILPAGVTLHSGTLNQPNISVRCQAGEYWLTVSVSDTLGNTSTRHIKIFAHDLTTFPPETLVDQISIESNFEGGINATIPSFSGMDDLPDGTLVTVWTDAEYDGVKAPIRVDAHGRLNNRSTGAEGDFTYQTIPHDLTAQVIGIGGEMSGIEAPKIAIRDSLNPTVWGEITRPTFWRAIWHILDRYSTLTTLYEIAFDDLSDRYIHPSPFAVDGGQLLTAINKLLSALNGGVQFSPDGVIECVRDGRWLSSSARDSLGVVATWSEHDALSYDAEHGTGGKVGFIQAFGASWNSATQISTPLSAIAPGLAFDRGDTSASLNEQVLRSDVSSHVAQAELTERAGHEYAYRNGGDLLTVNLPDGYSDLTPARNVWHVWALGELLHSGGRWLLTRLTYRHDNETGTRDVQATFERETIGQGGQALVLPPSDGVENIVPTFPPFDVYPAFPELPDVVFPSNDPIYIPPVTISPIAPNVPPRDGNVVMTWHERDVWLSEDYKKSNRPSWRRITPAIDEDEVIQDMAFGKGVEAFALSYDAVLEQSRVWQVDNVFASGARWRAGEYTDGEYQTLRVAPPPQTLYLAGVIADDPVASDWEEVWDFKSGADLWNINQNSPSGSLTYVADEGFKFEAVIRGNTQTRLSRFPSPARPMVSSPSPDHNITHIEIHISDRNLETSLNLSLPITVDPNSTYPITIPAGTGETVIHATVPSGGRHMNSYSYITANLSFRPIGNFITIEKIVILGTGLNPYALQSEPLNVNEWDFTSGTHGFELSYLSPANQTTADHVAGRGFRLRRDPPEQGVPANTSSRVARWTLPVTPEIPNDKFIVHYAEVEYDAEIPSQMWVWSYEGRLQQNNIVGFNAFTTGQIVNYTSEGVKWGTRRELTSGSQFIPMNQITMGLGTGLNPAINQSFYIRKLKLAWSLATGETNPITPPAQALLGYSADDGATISAQGLGDPPVLGVIGLDAVTIGDSAYAGVDGAIVRVKDDQPATPYASLPLDLGVAGGVIVAPRYQFDGSNNAVDEPDLIVGSPVLSDDDEALWQVTDQGDTLTDITPEIGGNYGVIASPNSLAVAWQDSEKRSLIAVIDDEKHLLTWDGATWVDRGVLGEGADYIRMRKQDSLGRELYFVDGECYYSPNYGVKLIAKHAPDEDMKGITIYG